jgi:hypothetical protein
MWFAALNIFYPEQWSPSYILWSLVETSLLTLSCTIWMMFLNEQNRLWNEVTCPVKEFRGFRSSWENAALMIVKNDCSAFVSLYRILSDMSTIYTSTFVFLVEPFWMILLLFSTTYLKSVLLPSWLMIKFVFANLKILSYKNDSSSLSNYLRENTFWESELISIFSLLLVFALL